MGGSEREEGCARAEGTETWRGGWRSVVGVVGGEGRPHTEDTETQRLVVHRVELALDRRAQRRGVVTGEKGEMLSEASDGRKCLTQRTQRHRGV